MKRSRILIADGDAKSRSTLSRYVEHMGYVAVTADTGFEALKLVRSENPDIVALDIMLSDMSGFEVLSIIKSDPHTFAVPVIMVTALSDDQHRIRSKELGADDFITKPYSFQEIRGRIYSIMKVRELHNDLEFSHSIISKLTAYQESILLNFDPRTFDVDDMLNQMMEKVIWKSYGATGPAVIVILFDDEAGWWRGKVFQVQESLAPGDTLAFPKQKKDNDVEEDSIRVMRLSTSLVPYSSPDFKAAREMAQYDGLHVMGRDAGLEDKEGSVKIFQGDEQGQGLHPEIIQAIAPINNYIRYRTPQLMVVASNFEKEPTDIDGEVLRSLFVNMSALKTIANQIKNIESAFHYTIEALSRAAEANDEDTWNHITRINNYCAILAEDLGMGKEYVHDLSFMAQMHDVGKLQVDPNILKKSSHLTGDEFEKVKLHTVYGARIIGDHPRLKIAREIAMSHHEKWDGSGYPLGLSSEDIPRSARIVAIVDVYDALRSKRPYKEPFGHVEAVEIITKGDSRTKPWHFDPDVKSSFMKLHKDMDEIYKEYEE